MMKNFYKSSMLVLACMLASMSAFSQFPAPYCNVDFPTAVEPISKVVFAGINNTSPATAGVGDPLENFLTLTANVNQGVSYPISIEGNTDGNFSSGVIVYIDWNRDNDFEDAGETYQIGILTNSTGIDGVAVTNTIAVPANALVGNTRMRVMKRYNAYPASCNTAGYGQAEDYTVSVAATSCLPVSQITVTNVTTNTADVSWGAVTGAVSYEYEISTSATAPASGTSTTATTVNATGLTSGTQYYVHVRANCGSTTSPTWYTVSFTTLCDPASTPYTVPLATVTVPALPACMLIENANADANTWRTANFTTPVPGFTNPVLVYTYHSTNNANDWLFTRALNLVGGTSYTLRFKYNNDGTVPADAPAYYFEKMKVMYGTAATSAAMTMLLVDYPTIASPAAQDAAIQFTPATTGVYYIGFHAYSDADQDVLLLSDISVNESNPVPVTLAEFKGEKRNEGNILSWKTVTEIDNKGFHLERSADGRTFSSLGFIASKAENGSSTAALNYEYADTKPFAGNGYYRLKQIDIDGRFAYSNVVLLKGGRLSNLVLSNVYPNPAKERLNVVISAPASNRVNLVVTDLAGKVVKQQAFNVIAGDNNYVLEVGSLPAGSYMLKALCENGCDSAISKFLKQ